MGFRFRKSFNAGPFRATLSKSGISTSVGVKGARITNRADGTVQATASIPGTGISHVSTIGETETPPKKKKGCLGGCATCIGVVLLLFVLGLFSGGSKEAPPKMQNELPQTQEEPAEELDLETIRAIDADIASATQQVSACVAAMYDEYESGLYSAEELIEKTNDKIAICNESIAAIQSATGSSSFSSYQNAAVSYAKAVQVACESFVDYLQTLSEEDLAEANSDLAKASAKHSKVKTMRNQCLPKFGLPAGVATSMLSDFPLNDPRFSTSKSAPEASAQPEPEPEAAPAPAPAPEPEPEPKPPAAEEPVAKEVIGNKNSKKFHELGCGSIADMKESNKIKLESYDAAIAKGYEPCQRCH